MKAALFVGGWEGHNPAEFADWYKSLLEENGFEVVIFDTLEPLAQPKNLRDIDIITPIWSSARSGHQVEFGNMTKPQEDGLLKLVGDGCGLVGWHGHMGDAFRDRPTYHFLIGGQFVAHPPGWPDNLQPKEDYIDYDVTICQPDHPLVEGIKSFRITSEQYYMLTDPSNNVLATTTFSGDNLWWIEGTVIPVTWTRRWDKGRVFYCSIGHELDDLKVPQVTEMIRRGAIWAARGKADARYLSLAAPVRSDHTFQIGSQIVATASNELSAFLDLGFDHL